MPARRYVEDISLAVMVVNTRSADVAQELNLSECFTCMPLPSSNKAAHCYVHFWPGKAKF